MISRHGNHFVLSINNAISIVCALEYVQKQLESCHSILEIYPECGMSPDVATKDEKKRAFIKENRRDIKRLNEFIDNFNDSMAYIVDSQSFQKIEPPEPSFPVNYMNFYELTREVQDDLLGKFVSKRCVACGGNWVAMLESGLKADFPAVWAVVEDKLPGYGDGGIPRFASLSEIIRRCIAVEYNKDNNYLQ